MVMRSLTSAYSKHVNLSIIELAEQYSERPPANGAELKAVWRSVADFDRVTFDICRRGSPGIAFMTFPVAEILRGACRMRN